MSLTTNATAPRVTMMPAIQLTPRFLFSFRSDIQAPEADPKRCPQNTKISSEAPFWPCLVCCILLFYSLLPQAESTRLHSSNASSHRGGQEDEEDRQYPRLKAHAAARHYKGQQQGYARREILKRRECDARPALSFQECQKAQASHQHGPEERAR